MKIAIDPSAMCPEQDAAAREADHDEETDDCREQARQPRDAPRGLRPPEENVEDEGDRGGEERDRSEAQGRQPPARDVAAFVTLGNSHSAKTSTAIEAFSEQGTRTEFPDTCSAVGLPTAPETESRVQSIRGSPSRPPLDE